MKIKKAALILLLSALFTIFSTVIAHAEIIYDYKDLVLYYNDTYARITKPVSSLVIYANESSAGDGGTLTVDKGTEIYFDTDGCQPGSALYIDGWDFQYEQPGYGFVLNSYVPGSMTLNTAGSWTFYLCVKGSIPSSSIYGEYDDWSANGSHKIVGINSGESMYWYFVKVTVNVRDSAPVADFAIFSGGADVTGGTVNVETLPAVVQLKNRSTNAASFSWYIKTPAHTSYVSFSNLSDPAANIFTPGITYFKLVVNGTVTVAKWVNVTNKKKPVAVITSPDRAIVGQSVSVSGSGSYSPNAGGYIMRYIWDVSPASGNLTDSSVQGTLTYQQAGTYTIKLSVIDNEGRMSAGATRTITVENNTSTPPPPLNPPVAAFSLSSYSITAGGSVTVTDSSYVSGAGEFLSAREWVLDKDGVLYYRGNTCPLQYQETGTYNIYLRVKSSNGLYSHGSDYKTWTMRTLTVAAADRSPPSVTVFPKTAGWTNKTINFNITATDAASLVSKMRYSISQFIDRPGSYSIESTDGTGNMSGSIESQGVWYVLAGATDANNNDSGLISAGPYKIDLTAPAISASNSGGSALLKQTTDITATDSGGSEVRRLKTSWSALTTKPSIWTENTGPIVTETISQVGTYYLHTEAEDNAGNITYRYFGPYTITAPMPRADSISIESSWNYWPDQPHRFLGLETVKINISTSGYADKVVIRFSPELEAMDFIDKTGNRYNYGTDFFGYTVSFPADSTCVIGQITDRSLIRWDYALPIAGDTLDELTGLRLAQPYKMYVTVYSGSKYATYVIDDIDITGTILDHIFLQPGNK